MTFIMTMTAIAALFAALIIVIVILNEREEYEKFPMSRKAEKAGLMNEEYRQ